METCQSHQFTRLLLVERLLQVAALEGRTEHARYGLFDLVRRVLAEGDRAAHPSVYDARIALDRVEFLGASQLVQVDLQLLSFDAT